MRTLLSKLDFTQTVGVSDAIPDRVFNTCLQVVSDTEIKPYLSTECVTDILGIDLEQETPDRPELKVFYETYVVPYISWSVYNKMAVTHGSNWGSQGIVKFTDNQNTSEAIDKNERRSIINFGESSAASYLQLMRRAFGDASQTFDGVTYELDEDKFSRVDPRPANINPIGRKKPYAKNRM